MAIINADLSAPVLHSALTDEHIADIRGMIQLQIKEHEYFSNFCEKRAWPKGRTSIQYRTKVHTHVASVVPLTENVAPRALSLDYATFERTTQDYGTKFAYTSKDVNYNIDNIVADASDELGQWATETKNIIVGTALVGSKCVVTPETTLVATVRKVAVIANKLGWLPVAGSEFACLTTPEVVDALTEELASKSGQPYELPDTLKEKAINGYIGSFKRFAFSTAICDKVMVTNDGTNDYHYMIFIGKMSNGKLPAEVYSMNDVQVFNNPLGSGILLDADGKLTSDDNKQKGSVALNMTGLSAHVVDDRCIIVVKFKIATVAVDTLPPTSMDARTEHVDK